MYLYKIYAAILKKISLSKITVFILLYLIYNRGHATGVEPLHSYLML